MVEGLSKANKAQLVGTQSGDVLVKLYDWTGWFLQRARRIPSIKQAHHFVFSARHKGKLLLPPLGYAFIGLSIRCTELQGGCADGTLTNQPDLSVAC